MYESIISCLSEGRSNVQSLNMMELSTLLAGSGLLPRKSGGSLNKAQLVALLQDALQQDQGTEVGLGLGGKG